MLVINKIDENMTEVINTDTGTPFDIPSHWLCLDEKIQVGDVIKVIKDEVNSRRNQKKIKEGQERVSIFYGFDELE